MKEINDFGGKQNEGNPTDSDASDDFEAEVQRLNEIEEHEVRREILLGQIAKARSKLYTAIEKDQTELIAELDEKIAKLTRERGQL